MRRKIATVKEVLQMYTAILRGEASVSEDGEPLPPPKYADIMKAGDAILKWYENSGSGSDGGHEYGVVIMPAAEMDNNLKE